MSSAELKFEELVLKPYAHKNRRHPIYFVVVPFDDPSIVQMTDSEDIILEVKANSESGKLDIQSVYSSHPFHSAIYDKQNGSRLYLIRRPSLNKKNQLTRALHDNLYLHEPMRKIGKIKLIE